MIRTLSLSRIRISDDFKKTPPKEEKLEECRAYWDMFGRQDRYIVLDNRNELIDGYAQYLVLKELGVKKCETVTYFGSRGTYNNRWRRIDNDIYVWGRHMEEPSNNKEYVWRIPKHHIISGVYKNWKVGDEILVQTKYGEKKAIIVKIGNEKDYPNFNFPERIKEVIRNLSSYKVAMREYNTELADMLGY